MRPDLLSVEAISLLSPRCIVAFAVRAAVRLLGERNLDQSQYPIVGYSNSYVRGCLRGEEMRTLGIQAAIATFEPGQMVLEGEPFPVLAAALRDLAWTCINATNETEDKRVVAAKAAVRIVGYSRAPASLTAAVADLRDLMAMGPCFSENDSFDPDMLPSPMDQIKGV